ncbi:hypothetical protein PanWU01x14_362040 [Parasponia andersonii]|uniref:Uncharacterized protein n=1 Tax=Parasponia andersonii TaxID=3476 RepID=A0A2P5A735_PARAD|nr:hypothetical protein PanWU01x14_362040 [Parasponia andersonii]
MNGLSYLKNSAMASKLSKGKVKRILSTKAHSPPVGIHPLSTNTIAPSKMRPSHVYTVLLKVLIIDIIEGSHIYFYL